jgi:hypothetical protein
MRLGHGRAHVHQADASSKLRDFGALRTFYALVIVPVVGSLLKTEPAGRQS